MMALPARALRMCLLLIVLHVAMGSDSTEDQFKHSLHGHAPLKNPRNNPGVLHSRRPGHKHGGQHIPEPWGNVPLPTKSHFAGLPVPTDAARWKDCIRKAHSGEQVLLRRVLEFVKSPHDFIRHDDPDRGVLKNTWEIKRAWKDGWLDNLPPNEGTKAHIVLLGYHENTDNKGVQWYSLSPNDMYHHNHWKISSKMVGIGYFNDNWGYLSTTFVNRSVGWGTTFGDGPNHMDKDFKLGIEQAAPLVNDPNLLMLVVNQHHNFTQEKVISVPLGVPNHLDTWAAMRKVRDTDVRKSKLIFTAGSDYFFRPAIRECVKQALGASLHMSSSQSGQAEYLVKLADSYTVLAPPGLGADTWRIWEALAVGCIPVCERGMGLDRTFYKLPVLLLDDYYYITELDLRQAYLEALYWEDWWDYSRMTKKYWEHLIYQVSESGSIDILLKNHPMAAVDLNFTRPLVPFDCEQMGGCGPGTKRVPKKSCAIDPQLVWNRQFEWHWS